MNRPINAKEIDLALKDLRAQLRKMAPSNNDLRVSLYRESETLIAMAQDFRSLIAHGGKWDPEWS